MLVHVYLQNQEHALIFRESISDDSEAEAARCVLFGVNCGNVVFVFRVFFLDLLFFCWWGLDQSIRYLFLKILSQRPS